MSRQLEPKPSRADQPEIVILRLDDRPTDPATEQELRRLVGRHLPTLEEHGVDLVGEAILCLIVKTPTKASPSENEKNTSQKKRSWQADFLDWLRRGQTVRRAAELSGVTPRWAYYCRRTDPAFRKHWLEAVS